MNNQKKKKANINMKFLIIIFILISIGCQNQKNNESNAKECCSKLSYLEIPIDSLGNLPQTPYVISLQNGKNQLLVYGTIHSNDSTNNMFDIIESGIIEFNPDIVIHEGGVIEKTFLSRNKAIVESGELGLLKYLADKEGFLLLNGDINFNREFNELLKIYTREEVMYFFITQRFIFPLIHFSESTNLDSLYLNEFVDGYLKSNKINLLPEEKELKYYYELYKKYNGKRFELNDIDYNHLSPIVKGGHFNDVARKSAEIRDDYLLENINRNLQIHKKVMVVFGGWHILVLEPKLNQLMNEVEK